MSNLSIEAELDDTGTEPWDRITGEPAKDYAAFRIYRDLAPYERNIATVAQRMKLSGRRIRAISQRWNWRERAEAWDDACHRVEDQERLEAIRSMHALHRRAGRSAILKAIEALGMVPPAQLPVSTIARLMELGAKLERSTLIVSVEELQGIDNADEEEDDPWSRIARELDPNNPPDA